MAQNIFEELQEKKQKLLSIADKAQEYGWISKSRQSGNDKKDVLSLEEIKEKLDKDTLTIGVIGQMKCGKSTFLNSFVFENDILPAATTPMTAALSVITYGEKERVVAEFYTRDEWAEQKQQASRDENDANEFDKSKIKAAKELMAKSVKLGSSLESYLGTKKEDNFENLIEYVGADGKYISITKSVTIYYPKEYLKGVEIVDTPGFNDPIVSREERTKEFLKKADVVLVMLYAGRPFDSTDRDIIFKNVRQCGIGKVLVGINKYDIPYCNTEKPEDETQIKEYVKSEIRKACREFEDNTMTEILNDVEPIPLSAEMALLSELPMSKISNSDVLDFAWKRHCSNFGIGTQREMREWSHIDDLVKAVKEMVDKEKSKILFAKPLNAIVAAGEKIKADTNTELNLLSSKYELLLMPDNEIDEKEESLAKANKKISKKINYLGDELDIEIQKIVIKGKKELEDMVDVSCKRMKDIILNEWSRLKGFETVEPRLDAELQNLITRKLKRATEQLSEDGKKKIDRCVSDFFTDAEDLLMRFLPEFDSREFVKTTRNKIKMDIDAGDLFTMNSESDDSDYGFGNFLADFLNGFTFGVFKGIGNVLSHNDDVAAIESRINSISSDFDPQPYLDNAFKSKDEVVEFVKQTFIHDLIEPLQQQIQEIREKKADREKELKVTKEKIEALEKTKKLIAIQLSEISNMKAGL